MAASLLDMAVRACIYNVDGLEDLGDYPYRLVRPILKKVKTPGQLAELERNSPHIADEDGELWQAFIRRDIPNGESKLPSKVPANVPGRPSSWSQVYRRLKKEDQRQQNAAEEVLKAALNKSSVEKAGKTTQFVHAVISEPRKAVWGAPRAAPSGSQALKNARTTADRLTILKRQTAHRQAGRTITQSIPSHELQQKRSVVQQAPRSMVNQYNRTNVNSSAQISARIQREASPPRHVKIFTSRRDPVSDRDRAINAAIRQEREDKERRLRALTGATKSTVSQPQQSSTQPPRSAAPVTSRMVPPPSRPAVNATPRAAPAPAKPVKPVAPVSNHASQQTPTTGPAPSKSTAPQPAASSNAPPPQKRRYKYDPFLPAKKRRT